MALTLTLGMQTRAHAADGKEQSRMVFEPGSTEPAVHTDTSGKPVKDNQSADAEPAQASQPEATDTAEPKTPAETKLPTPPPAPANMPVELARVLDIFFGQLIKGNTDVAYTTLTKGTVLEREATTLTSLKASTTEAQKLFGAYRGYEILRVEEVGNHLLRVSCISLGDLFPLSWNFFYYRPDGEWRLIDIRVGAALNELFPDKPAEVKKASVRTTGETK